MKLKYKHWLLIILLFTNFIVKSQEDVFVFKDEFKTDNNGFLEAWRNVKKGERKIELKTKGGYTEALDYFKQAYNYNPNNAELNYQIGICYLNSIFKPKSLSYFKKAYNKRPELSRIKWYLANAYQYNYLFDSAIIYFQDFMDNMKSYDIREYRKKTQQKIEECRIGKKLYDNPVKVKISNIKNINSKYPDYCPVISADESMMIFTSRREGASEGMIDKRDGQNYEDIYLAFKILDEWLPPKNIGYPLNTTAHDATVGLSADGQKMLIYRNGDLYLCELDGEEWTEPEKLPETINTTAVENSACFSQDGNSIYFIRGRTQDNRSNGDIYITTKSRGKWSRPKKLSPTINTKFDEDGVFLHPDGKTLYFSSKGHETMGGFDIFKTVKQKDGTWSKPVNLGYPINTPDDDVYFVMAANGQTGYYSSVKDDALGFTDIYKVSYIKDEKPIKVKDSLIVEQNTNQSELTLVTGIITDAVSNKPIQAQVEIYDNEKNKLISTSVSNKKTGKFLVSLPSGKNYGMVIKSDNYLFYSENFNINEKEKYKKVDKEISLYNVEEGSKVILKNLFFDSNKSEIRPESYTELEIVKQLLTDYENIRLEISGYTDNTGAEDLNKKLSLKRAEAVVSYLVSKGVDKNRLEYKGFGKKNPIADNNTEKGRQLNRRVEIKIIK